MTMKETIIERIELFTYATSVHFKWLSAASVV